ncbi:TrmH family RNA methyltransferase [Balneolaceae bacterium ANBcel3]|nr:TrmH family RNA methyltransferase [Balneolaceae bacterium ANBcel3]
MSGISEKKTTREIFEINQARSVPGPVGKLMIWLHNVRSMHNVGSAFRTADAFGIQTIILSGYTPCPPRPEISKTALGADETVSWMHMDQPDEVFAYCKKQQAPVYGIEQTHHSMLLTEFYPEETVPACLLFGNEVTGIEDELIKKCDLILEIPQYGHKHSLNISVCIGITLYHFLSKVLSK